MFGVRETKKKKGEGERRINIIFKSCNFKSSALIFNGCLLQVWSCSILCGCTHQRWLLRGCRIYRANWAGIAHIWGPVHASSQESRLGALWMTDYSEAEQIALEEIFPDCTVYLCDFHHEQAWGRWVRSHRSGLSKPDQQELIGLLRSLAWAPPGSSEGKPRRHFNMTWKRRRCDGQTYSPIMPMFASGSRTSGCLAQRWGISWFNHSQYYTIFIYNIATLHDIDLVTFHYLLLLHIPMVTKEKIWEKIWLQMALCISSHALM